MNKQQLLQEVEALSFTQRVHRLTELGRAALSNAELEQTLSNMEQADFYERYLALQACFGSRNGSTVLRSLADPSAIIRRQALKLVPLACSEEQHYQALQIVAADLRAVLIRYLHGDNFQRPIDAFLHLLAEHKDRQLGTLLAFGSAATVEQHLAQVLPRFNLAQWKRLAKWHPDIALQALRTRVEEEPEAETQLIRLFNALVPILTQRRPDALVALLQTPRLAASLAQLKLKTLWRRRPNELFELLNPVHEYSLDNQEDISDNIEKLLSRLSFEHLQTFLQQQGLYTHIPLRCVRLAPQQRLDLYNSTLQYWRNGEGLIPLDVLAALPKAQREQEARRICFSTSLSTKQHDMRTLYAHFLPWSEALQCLDYHLQHSDSEKRGTALHVLALIIAYQRSHLDDLLVLFRAHRNEPDPVRSLMFTGLCEIPQSCWQSRHLLSLTELIQQARAAADTSHKTVRSIASLLVRLIASYPEWSAQELATLMQFRGEFVLPAEEFRQDELPLYVTEQNARRMLPILLATFENWVARDQASALAACAYGFRRYLHALDDLVTLLEQTLQKVRDAATAEKILALLIKWRMDRAEILLPTLLEQDPSWILLPCVPVYLQRYRSDLLTPFLELTSIQGRFSVAETAFVLPLHGKLLSFTQAQQLLFARTQEKIFTHPQISWKQREQAIMYLAALPAVPPTRLLELTQDHEDKRFYRLTALSALANYDADLPAALIMHVVQQKPGQDASVTQPALRTFTRLIKHLPARQAFEILSTASFTHLMAKKAVVLLLGELPLEEAYQHLLTLAATPDLHPDIYAAVIRALWNHLDRSETWDLLRKAAAEPSNSMATKIGHISTEHLTAEEQQQLLHLFKTILLHPKVDVHLELLQRLTILSLHDTEQILTPTLLQFLPEAYTAAAEMAVIAFLAICTERDILLLQESIHTLYTNPQRLAVLMPLFNGEIPTKYFYNKKYRYTLKEQPRKKYIMIKAVAAALASHPFTSMMQVKLVCHVLPAVDILPVLIQLAQNGDLHSEALMEACSIIERYARQIKYDELMLLETSLAQQADERLRRIALSALKARTHTRFRAGWTPEHIARLRVYQSDPAPLVAEAALFIFP